MRMVVTIRLTAQVSCNKMVGKQLINETVISWTVVHCSHITSRGSKPSKLNITFVHDDLLFRNCGNVPQIQDAVLKGAVHQILARNLVILCHP